MSEQTNSRESSHLHPHKLSDIARQEASAKFQRGLNEVSQQAEKLELQLSSIPLPENWVYCLQSVSTSVKERAEMGADRQEERDEAAVRTDGARLQM